MPFTSLLDQKTIDKICGLYEEINKSNAPALSSVEADIFNSLIDIAKKNMKDDDVVQKINPRRIMGTITRTDALVALRMIKEALGLK